MRKVLAVAWYTFLEHLRQKAFLLVGLFGLLICAAALVTSSLAADERLRVLLDAGLAGIELIALTSVVFVTVQLVLSEVENRAVYLLLSRPLPRAGYVAGRYLGALAAAGAAMAAMAAVHLAVLAWRGWTWTWLYPLAVGCAFAKVAVVASLALFLSMVTTSSASAMAFTVFLWLLGHFSEELRFLAARASAQWVKALVWAERLVAPDLSYYSLTAFWNASSPPPAAWLAWLAAYTSAYVGLALWAASWVFSKKEF